MQTAVNCEILAPRAKAARIDDSPSTSRDGVHAIKKEPSVPSNELAEAGEDVAAALEEDFYKNVETANLENEPIKGIRNAAAFADVPTDEIWNNRRADVSRIIKRSYELRSHAVCLT